MTFLDGGDTAPASPTAAPTATVASRTAAPPPSLNAPAAGSTAGSSTESNDGAFSVLPRDCIGGAAPGRSAKREA